MQQFCQYGSVRGATGNRRPYRDISYTLMTLAAHFDIYYTRFLDENGKPLSPLSAFALDTGQLLPLYRWMTLIRAYDARAIALQRTGQLGTFASMLGQEAIQAGIASAMAPDDVLLTTYREQGALMMRGVAIKELLLYWSGDERGSVFAGARGDFPICVTIAAHATHAVGVAYAFKLRQQARVAVCALGDGATSKGDFYEGINAAGAWKLPVVFFITNISGRFRCRGPRRAPRKRWRKKR